MSIAPLSQDNFYTIGTFLKGPSLKTFATSSRITWHAVAEEHEGELMERELFFKFFKEIEVTPGYTFKLHNQAVLNLQEKKVDIKKIPSDLVNILGGAIKLSSLPHLILTVETKRCTRTGMAMSIETIDSSIFQAPVTLISVNNMYTGIVFTYIKRGPEEKRYADALVRKDGQCQIHKSSDMCWFTIKMDWKAGDTTMTESAAKALNFPEWCCVSQEEESTKDSITKTYRRGRMKQLLNREAISEKSGPFRKRVEEPSATSDGKPMIELIPEPQAKEAS